MVDPLSYFSFQSVLQCNKGRGMCYDVCGMLHIQEPLHMMHIVHGLVAGPCTPPKKKKNNTTTTKKQQQKNPNKQNKTKQTKLGGYFIVAWVSLVKKNYVNRKKPHSQGTCHPPF